MTIQISDNATQNQLQNLFQILPTGVFTVDTKKRITSWNMAAEKITSLKRETVMGKTCLEIWKCEACLKGCGLFNTQVQKPVFNKLCNITLPDKRSLSVLKNIDLIYDFEHNCTGGIEILTDVTEQIHQEKLLLETLEKLEKAQSILKEKNREILDFAHSVTHDLKKPLATMLNVISIISDINENTTCNDTFEALALGNSAVNYMKEMLDDLLECARLEAGEKIFNPPRIRLSTILNNVLSQFKIQIDENNISITSDNIDVELYIDNKIITKVFMNLIGNAINYRDVTKKNTIDIRCYTVDKNCIIAIKDNGIGIPEHEQIAIFSKFKRGANSKGVAGTGLGLSIVKSGIEVHGGTVWVESNLQVGSTFFISLPSR